MVQERKSLFWSQQWSTAYLLFFNLWRMRVASTKITRPAGRPWQWDHYDSPIKKNDEEPSIYKPCTEKTNNSRGEAKGKRWARALSNCSKCGQHQQRQGGIGNAAAGTQNSKRLLATDRGAPWLFMWALRLFTLANTLPQSLQGNS